MLKYNSGTKGGETRLVKGQSRRINMMEVKELQRQEDFDSEAGDGDTSLSISDY